MALLGKHRRNPLAPDLLHRGKNAQFVVNEHIMISRIEALYVFELAFLVNLADAYSFLTPKAISQTAGFPKKRRASGAQSKVKTSKLQDKPNFPESIPRWRGSSQLHNQLKATDDSQLARHIR
jgi:hypothetical protein